MIGGLVQRLANPFTFKAVNVEIINKLNSTFYILTFLIKLFEIEC